MSKRGIVFCEDRADTEALIEAGLHECNEVIPLSVESAARLRDYHCSYRDITEFNLTKERARALWLDNRKRSLALADFLSERYEDIFTVYSHNIFYSFIYSWSCFYDYYSARIEEVHSILEKMQPLRVYVPYVARYNDSNVRWHKWHCFLYPYESLYLPIVRAVTTLHALPCESYGKSNIKPVPLRWQRDRRQDIVRQAKNMARKALFWCAAEIGRKEFVLTVSGREVFGNIASASGRKVFSADYLWNAPYKRFRELRTRGRLRTEAIMNNVRLRKLFYYKGVDISETCAERLRLMLNDLTFDLYNYAHEIDQFLQKYDNQIACIFSGVGTVPFHKMTVLRAVAHGKKNFSFQHGGLGAYGPGLSEVLIRELPTSDVYVCWGKNTEKDIKSLAFPELETERSVKFISLGSPLLSDMLHKKASAMPVTATMKSNIIARHSTLFYVPAKYLGNFQRVYNHGSPDLYYLNYQRRIIELFKTYNTAHNVLVLKLPYKGDAEHFTPLIDSVRNERNIEVVREPLANILDTADYFITDNPSTAFLEMLWSGKPVICFVNEQYLDISDAARNLLKKCCYFYTQEKYFFDALKNILQGTFTLHNMINPREFLRGYADNVSTAQMVRAIQKELV